MEEKRGGKGRGRYRETTRSRRMQMLMRSKDRRLEKMRLAGIRGTRKKHGQDRQEVQQ